MSGLITKVEVKANRAFIIEMYGREFYLACLKAEGMTYLGLLVKFKLI